MEQSNTRSNTIGAFASTLPFVGAALGIAAIAGVTGCHLEMLLIPFALIICGALLAIVVGVVAIRASRSKRGRIMPIFAIATGVASLVWVAIIAK
jgi:hypothetical protein